MVASESIEVGSVKIMEFVLKVGRLLTVFYPFSVHFFIFFASSQYL